jgi:hypothetical protein
VAKEANVTPKLSPAVIVTMGDAAHSVGELLADRYPVAAFPLPDGCADAGFEGLITLINDSVAGPDGATELPAVLIIADTDHSQDVLRVLDEIRAGATTVKPRVWPAIVAGHPARLAEFDAALDARRTSSCDLVLVMTGSNSPEEQADALSAWLHVKMPAPASVLADLPDSRGRICRYVGLGCVAVDVGQAPSYVSTTAATFDDAGAVEQICEELANVATSDRSVVSANSAVAALVVAAQSYSAADVMRSESDVTVALGDIERELAPSLEVALPGIVTEVVRTLSSTQEPQDAPKAVADASGDAAAEDVNGKTADGSGGRTETVSQLVLLASKGGLSKMFNRNRMAAVAETIEPLARADVSAAVDAALQQADARVPILVKDETQRLAEADAAALEQVAQTAQNASTLAWNQAVDKARREVVLWPTINIEGISRSWGGGVPAARQYVVASASALRLLAEDDAIMSVVDLRTQHRADTDDGDIDLRDQPEISGGKAMVLLAQYGLPLAALK